MTGGGCGAADYVVGGATAGLAHRLSPANRGLSTPTNRGSSVPDFVVTPGGDAIAIPSGVDGPLPTTNRSGRITGFEYTGGSGGHGFNSRTTGVRIMDPVGSKGDWAGYPYGYAAYMNANEPPQTINPYTGQTVRRSDPWAHLRFSEPIE